MLLTIAYVPTATSHYIHKSVEIEVQNLHETRRYYSIEVSYYSFKIILLVLQYLQYSLKSRHAKILTVIFFILYIYIYRYFASNMKDVTNGLV